MQKLPTSCIPTESGFGNRLGNFLADFGPKVIIKVVSAGVPHEGPGRKPTNLLKPHSPFGKCTAARSRKCWGGLGGLE